MPNQRCKSCKQRIGELHKPSCAKYYGMVLGGQELEADNTPTQSFESRLTDEDRRYLKAMRVSVEDIT